MKRELTLGTRGSALALAQCSLVERALQELADTTRRVIKTTGDRRTDVSLEQLASGAEGADKGVFIKELEIELLAGRISLAVHSLKDVPTELDNDFQLAAVLPREGVRDVLITRDKVPELAALPEGSLVGTGSVRRQRLLEYLQPQAKWCGVRGNVPTRLNKLMRGEGGMSALILAEAGLQRLNIGAAGELTGYPGLYASPLPPKHFLPAAGQGAIGIEILHADESLAALLQEINHTPTWKQIVAEREFLRLLGAGCHTPVGVWVREEANGLALTALVFPEEDGPPKKAEVLCPSHESIELARKAYESLRPVTGSS